MGDNICTERARTAETVEQFDFCIARPRDVNTNNGLKVWAHGTKVHFGCMDYARECRDHVRERTGEDYRVYMVVPVPEQ